MSINVTIEAIFVMLRWIVPTPIVRIIAHVRKDTLEMDIHVKVKKSSLHHWNEHLVSISYFYYVAGLIVQIKRYILQVA